MTLVGRDELVVDKRKVSDEELLLDARSNIIMMKDEGCVGIRDLLTTFILDQQSDSDCLINIIFLQKK